MSEQRFMFSMVFVGPDGDQKRTVQIGVPESFGSKWRCKLRILEVDKISESDLVGIDALQCIAIAMSICRRCMRGWRSVDESGDTPAEMIFYRVVPIDYGFELNALMEAKLDVLIARKEYELSERRRRRHDS